MNGCIGELEARLTLRRDKQGRKPAGSVEGLLNPRVEFLLERLADISGEQRTVGALQLLYAWRGLKRADQGRFRQA